MDRDQKFMEMAFAEAEKVKGMTLPNPPVGAVMVKGDHIVAKGGTRPAGQAHAEIVALRRAGVNARGATLYVTLEPCCHFGKTPPCTKAIIAAGIKRVVIACQDPNPKVSGKGIAALRRAGITTKVGVLQTRGQWFYEGFFFYITHRRPKIILKIAQSQDGRINARAGVETRITGAKAKVFSHGLRAQSDAVLIGGKTLRVDNPALTPRLHPGSIPEALVLTRKHRFLAKYKLFSAKRVSKTTKVSLSPSLDSDKKKAHALIELFQQKGYHMVLVEGGRSVWAPFLNSGLFDTLYLLTAPVLFPKGERWVSNLKPGWVKTLEFHRFTPFGPDILAEFRNVYGHRTRKR